MPRKPKPVAKPAPPKTRSLRGRYGPSPADLAGRIREERERLGLTAEATATMLGISRSTYRQLETAANPQASTLVALVQEVGMRLESLLPEALIGS